MLLSVCAAVLAFALRPDILPGKVRRIRDQAAGPVQALAFSGLVALVMTAIAGVVLILTTLDTGKPAAFASLLVALPNAMIYAVLTGMGVSSQVTAGGTASLDPLGYFLSAHGIVVIAIFTVASFVNRQDAIDHWHGAHEDN